MWGPGTLRATPGPSTSFSLDSKKSFIFSDPQLQLLVHVEHSSKQGQASTDRLLIRSNKSVPERDSQHDCSPALLKAETTTSMKERKNIRKIHKSQDANTFQMVGWLRKQRQAEHLLALPQQTPPNSQSQQE